MGSLGNIEYLRSFRLQGFAVFDIVVSFIAMWLLGRHYGHTRQFIAATLPLSVLVHLAFGQMTPLTRMTVGPRYLHVKVLMLVLCWIALATSN